MTLWKTVEELGLQDSIEKDQAVLNQIVELLRSTYQGKSHNFKKKFFVDYFSNVKRTEKALENLHELIKYRIENDVNYIADLKYLSLKFNCTLEEAEKISKEQSELKQDRSLEGFIKRHGPIKGPAKFKQFKDRCSVAAHKKREKYKDDFKYKVRVNNKRCKEYYTSRGYSEDEAKALVSEYQRLNSGSQVDYWVARGYSEREAKSKVESLMNRRGASYEYIKEKYPDTWESVIQDRLEAYRKTVGAINPEWCDEWETYRDQVRGLTSTSLKLYGDRIKGYSQDLSKGFHVDHVFSVKAGFLSGVKPEIVAHWSNLQVLSAETNLSKGSSCSKDINELFEDYYESLKD